MIGFKKVLLLAAALAASLAFVGCGDDNPIEAEALDCGPGENKSIDGISLCVIDNELLIETGFMCGPELERYEGEEVTICAEGDLSPEQLNEFEGFSAPVDPQPEMTPEPEALPEIELGTSDLNVSGCNEEEEPMEELLLESAGLEEEGHEVRVTHSGFAANCCAIIESVTATIDGDVINLTYDINEDNPCDCICTYTMNYKVTNVPAGNWGFSAGMASSDIELD